MTHTSDDEEEYWDLHCHERKLCNKTYECEQNLYRTPKDQWRLDHYDEWDPQKEKTARGTLLGITCLESWRSILTADSVLNTDCFFQNL